MKKSLQSVSIWPLVSLASIPLVMTLGNSMLIPVLPLIEKELNISSFQSSLFITCYSVASIFLIPVAGFLSDKIGRKKVILPSQLIVIIGGLISGIAASMMENPYWIIIIGRTLQGIGAAGAAPIVLALVGDLYKKDEEVSASLGVIETSNTFGKVVSPILGALLASVVWFLPFYMISVFSLISFLLVLFLVKAKKKIKPIPFRQSIDKTKEIFQIEGRWLYTLFAVGGYAMFVLFAIQVLLSDTLEVSFHMQGVKKGLVLAVPLLLLCISSLYSGKVVKGDKPLMKKIIVISLLVQAISLLFLRSNLSLFLLLLIICVIAVTVGFVLPVLDALITENVEKSQTGIITAFFSSARFLGVATAPPIISILIKDNSVYPFIVGGLISGLLIILVFKKIQV